jgi:hypothetical protein
MMPGAAELREPDPREDWMSRSLLRARPQTHVKIVILALVGAILIVLGSITAHVNQSHDLARLQAHAPVVKAMKPVSFTGRSTTAVR